MTLCKTQVLARVNGVEITATDAAPSSFGSETTEISISREQFQFLLNRAIEQHLVISEARRAGITLSSEDMAKLAKLRESRRHDDDVVDPIGNQQAIIEAEAVEAETQLIEKQLLQRNGVPLPYVTEEMVREYYEQHTDDFPDLPQDPAQHGAVWQQIDLAIREELAPQVRRDYLNGRSAYMAELREAAGVEILAAEG
ncbi:MAG: hypothetical protein HUU46_23440 [Candidatus Hydrogenedentes bacterium]|nr:hypothetical protein [Candidatus Hydrogenedentota bacterium]